MDANGYIYDEHFFDGLNLPPFKLTLETVYSAYEGIIGVASFRTDNPHVYFIGELAVLNDRRITYLLVKVTDEEYEALKNKEITTYNAYHLASAGEVYRTEVVYMPEDHNHMFTSVSADPSSLNDLELPEKGSYL